MCDHISLSKKKKNKSNYPLLPNLSLHKNFFQITLNMGHLTLRLDIMFAFVSFEW